MSILIKVFSLKFLESIKIEFIFLLKILARWVLPHPLGPYKFIHLSGQFGHESINLYASKLFEET